MNDEYAKKGAGYFGTPRREMLMFIPREVTRVLEIGCGTGAFGAVVKDERHCFYTGVELLQHAADKARNVLDEVIVADVERDALPFPQASFDCLVCNDVLEHLRDPWTALRTLTGFVRIGGYVVASLPNVRFSEVVKDLIFRKRWEYQERGVLDRTHLRFFTASSVRTLFESSGLEVVQLQGINGIRYSWKLGLVNILLLGALNDMRYLEYACVGRVR